NRIQHGSAALKQKLYLAGLEVGVRSKGKCAPRRKHDNSLEGRRRIAGQEEKSRHTFLAVGRLHGNFLPTPVRRVVRQRLYRGVERRAIVRVETLIDAKPFVADGPFLRVVAQGRFDRGEERGRQ